MSLLASVLSFVLIPLVFVLLYWGGALLSRLFLRKLPPLLCSALLLGAVFVATPLVFDALGHDARGTVIAKSETIETGSYGVTVAIYHHFDVLVATGASREALDLALSASVFDRLHKGQSVSLRIIALGPMVIARLSDQSWYAAFPLAELERLLFATAWPLTITALLALLAFFRFGSVVRAVLASVILAAVIVDAFLLRAWWEPRAETAQAAIRSVRTVREADLLSWLSANSPSASSADHVVLPKAYDEIELAFRPGSASEPVLAVDRVDAGSAGQIVRGQTVGINYWASDSRSARMVKGVRTYAWRNDVEIYGVEFGLLALILFLGSGLSTFGDRLRTSLASARSRRKP